MSEQAKGKARLTAGQQALVVQAYGARLAHKVACKCRHKAVYHREGHDEVEGMALYYITLAAQEFDPDGEDGGSKWLGFAVDYAYKKISNENKRETNRRKLLVELPDGADETNGRLQYEQEASDALMVEEAMGCPSLTPAEREIGRGILAGHNFRDLPIVKEGRMSRSEAHRVWEEAQKKIRSHLKG